MAPYYIFLALVIAIYAWYQKAYGNKVLLTAILLLLVLFAGLRDSKVGTDTGSYTRKFQSLVVEDEVKDNPLYDPTIEGDTFWEQLQDEPGFYQLRLLARRLSNQYHVLLIMVALIVCCCILTSIHLVSQNELVSIFVFITLGLYTFSFNAERQGIAIAIYSLSIPFLIRKKFLYYSIIVIIAALFHKTIIVTLPLYFLLTMRFSWKSALLIVVGVSIITSLMPLLIDFGTSLEQRYQLYGFSEETTGLGWGVTVFYTLLAIFFVWRRQFIDKRLLYRYDVFLHMIICAAIIYLVVAIMGLYVETNRFAAYFQISAIFLWAELFANPSKKLSWGLTIVFVVGHLIYFYIFTDRMASLTPYIFNETLFGVDESTLINTVQASY